MVSNIACQAPWELLSLVKDLGSPKAINHVSHFFLETGGIFSEHKLSAAFAAKASAFTLPLCPRPSSPLTYFMPAGVGLRFLPLPQLQELFVFSTVWFIYSSFQH